MDKLLLVALGGSVGSVARYLTGMAALRWLGPKSAWAGTLTVNLVGGLLMGLLVGWLAHRGGEDANRWSVLLGVGVLGGYTTFSAFSLDASLMLQRRDWLVAGGYLAVSVLGSILALLFGLGVARRLFA